MRQPRRPIRLLALAAALPLLGASGCLSLLTAGQSTASKARRLARFDSDCPSMRVVARLGDERYRLRGCGQELLYACGKRTESTGIGRGPRPRTKAGAAIGLAAMLLIGPTVTNTDCQLVASRRVGPPPAPTTRWPASRQRPTALDDEPGVSVPASKTAGARATRDSTSKLSRPDLRDVRAEMVRIRPQLLACAAKRPNAAAVVVPVGLRVSAAGVVTEARVAPRALDPSTRRCLEAAFRSVRLPARAKGPRWLRYRVRVR